MSQESAVYDLGDLDRGTRERSAPGHESPAPARRTDLRELRRHPKASIQSARPWTGRDFGRSLSVLVPGSGQVIRGDHATGLFFLTSLAFVAALAWALTGSIDRLAATLALLGHPPALAVWALAGLFVVAAALHIGSVLDAGFGSVPARNPLVAAIASGMVPGWGQLLNGDRFRAVFFIAMLWLAGAGWILVSPAAESLMAELRLYLPSWAAILATPAVRWTLPAIIWTLAVYDAASRAAADRRLSS
jgi:hypothetical protein